MYKKCCIKKYRQYLDKHNLNMLLSGKQKRKDRDTLDYCGR